MLWGCLDQGCQRSRTSSVVVHIGSNSIPFFTELQALKKKNADTIASALIAVLCELLTTILGDETPAVPLQVLHVCTGDGINTNAAALKRVYRYMAKTWSKKDWISYRLLNWKCSSHRANLVVQYVVCDGQRDSLLRANCSRLYKYIIPAYADEIGHNLRTYVVEKLVVEGGDVPPMDRRSDYFVSWCLGWGSGLSCLGALDEAPASRVLVPWMRLLPLVSWCLGWGSRWGLCPLCL